MNQPYWIRPGLILPAPIDTVIFDVDGVLWDTGESFDVAVQETVEHFTKRLASGRIFRPVCDEELRAFRRAGGLNNDWDMSYTLIALRLAGRGDFARAAEESSGRGRQWARTLLPTGTPLAYDEVVEFFNQVYWGAQMFARHFGREAVDRPDAPGTWRGEKAIVEPTLFSRLGEQQVVHFGIATGRSKVELGSVLATDWLARHFADTSIVTGDQLEKPDGRVLERVMNALNLLSPEEPTAALYCGDTRDDLDVVLNYRRLQATGSPWISAVGVMPHTDWPLYQEAGSDILIESINQLPELISQIEVGPVSMEGSQN